MGFGKQKPIDFDFKKPYPTEFSYIEDLEREAQNQLIQMNQGMFNFPDKGVPTAFDKPEEGEWRFAKRDHLIDALKAAQAAYRNSIQDWVAEEMKRLEVDPKIARWVRGNISTGLFIHYSEAQEATRAQMLKNTRPVKEELGTEDSAVKDASNNKIKEPEKSTRSEKMFPFLSARYSQSLGFTKATEKTKKSLDKLSRKDIEPEKD